MVCARQVALLRIPAHAGHRIRRKLTGIPMDADHRTRESEALTPTMEITRSGDIAQP
jgi:hypothetical protein